MKIEAFLMVLGVILLLVKGMSVEYVDAQGVLHENFFLIPMGFLCLFGGMIPLLAMGIGMFIRKIKNQKA